MEPAEVRDTEGVGGRQGSLGGCTAWLDHSFKPQSSLFRYYFVCPALIYNLQRKEKCWVLALLPFFVNLSRCILTKWFSDTVTKYNLVD